MAYEQHRDGGDVPVTAGASFASSQYLAVEITSAATSPVTATVCNGTTDQVYGILQDAVASGRVARVRKSGITKWVSDGQSVNIARGDPLGVDASGRCIKKTTAGDIVRGVALESSTATGTIIAVDLDIQRMIPA